MLNFCDRGSSRLLMRSVGVNCVNRRAVAYVGEPHETVEIQKKSNTKDYHEAGNRTGRPEGVPGTKEGKPEN